MLAFFTGASLRRNVRRRSLSTAPMEALKTGLYGKSVLSNDYEGAWKVSRDRIEKITLKSTSQFRQFYDFENCQTEPLGYGTFGSVHICKPKGIQNAPRYAVKQMQKSRQPFYSREIEMLKRVTASRHCIQLKRIYETPNSVFLVTELLNGGDLFDFIVQNNVVSGTLSFEESLLLTRKMLLAIEECHLQNFSHLDIKPENFVFREKVDDIESSELVLVDFGAAQPYVLRPFARNFGAYIKGKDDLWKGTRKTKITGTISYVSPEIFLYNRFSSRSDVWSLGISLFMMLTGQRPFEAKCEKKIEALVVEESKRARKESVFVNHPALVPIKCPHNIQTLLIALTEPKPENRPSSSEALRLVDQLLQV